MHRLVEIDQRGRGNAVGAEAEIDLVEIELEDLVLGISALDLQRQHRFLDLALHRQFVRQQEVLGDLLGDRGRALRAFVRPVILHQENRRARHAAEIEAAMFVEILVFGGEEGVDHHLRHRLDRDIEPALGGVFRDQRTVAGMHAGHHRRLVILQLGIVRQVLGEMPHQAGDAGHADQEQDGPHGEQKAEEPQSQLHGRTIPFPRDDFLAAAPARPAGAGLIRHVSADA
jgi:hypothetical protein